MDRTALGTLSIPLFLLTGALAGCGGSDSPGSGDLVVAPDPANVATCRSRKFTATPADGVTWSLDGPGKLADATYTAPLSVPSPASAKITATAGDLTASSAITLATAFPEAAIDTARVTSTTTPDHVHGISGRGARVYALLEGHTDTSASLAVVRSDDGGLTWRSPVALPEGDRAASIAIDAGDAETVYVTIHGKDKDAGSTLDLAVSTDGGATFTTYPLFVGGNGEAQDADVASPAAGTVVVAAPATWQDGNGGQGATLLRWRDTKKGAGLLPLTGLDNGYMGQWSPGVEHRLGSGRLIESNDERGGPQFATNGKGTICLITSDYDINETDEHDDLACSSDGGATFGDFAPVVTGKPAGIRRSRVAIGADGKLVVVAWNAFDTSISDPIGQTKYEVSTDGGKTFGQPHTHADVPDGSGANQAVDYAEVAIDSAGVIWFSRTMMDASLQLDKSCDQGETLSGAFTVPIAGSHVNGLFFESSAGLFAGAVRRGDTDMGLTVVRLLEP